MAKKSKAKKIKAPKAPKAPKAIKPPKGGLQITATGFKDSKGTYDKSGRKIVNGQSNGPELDREGIAKQAVQTTNRLYGGDPNIKAYGEEFTPGSGGFDAPATNDNYGLDKPIVPKVDPLVGLPQAIAPTTTPTTSQIQPVTYGDLVNKDGTIYDSRNGNAYDSPDSLGAALGVKANEINWGGIKANSTYSPTNLPLTPVNVQPSPTTPTTALTGLPKTSMDVQSIIARNQANREKYLAALSATATENALQTQIDDIVTRAKTTSLEALAGIKHEEQRLVPMQAIIGAQKVIQDEANLQLQTLAAQEDTVVRKLQLEQTKRQALLDTYKVMLQFGQEDLALAQDLAAQTKAEQKEAKQLALTYGIDQEFYNIGGTIYRTSDGKAYSSPEEFFKDGGKRDWSNVSTINATAQDEKDVVKSYALNYPDAGINLKDTLATAQAKLSSSAKYQKSIRTSSGGGGGDGDGTTPTQTTDAAVRKFIQAKKKENPDKPWYDVWGEIADEIRSTLKVDPGNYNALLWELLHPEGSAGYDKYVKNKRS